MTDTIRCRAVDGSRRTLRLAEVGPAATAGTLPARLVAVDGETLLQKWLPRLENGRPAPLDALDAEILATHRFAELFPADAYPTELPRLRFYDVDSEDPFVLLTPYRGVPVPEVLAHMTSQDRRLLQTGLLRALHFAGMVGVVHGRIGHDALRWDAATRSVQLVDFEHAVVGDVRADMWDAGLALWRTEHPEHLGSDAPDLDGGALSTLLAGVFVEPASRPTPGELLARLREFPQARAVDLAARLHPGVQAFDAEVQRKRDRQTPVRPTPWWSRLRLGKPAPGPALVRCPVCLDSYPAPDDGLWRRDEHGKYHELEAGPQDPLKTELDLVNMYRRCPNPSRDSAEHFLPANYFAHDTPLVVALVGQPTAGKTHLLAAMVREAVERNGLAPYGLTAVPMDLHLHDAYRSCVLEPAGRGQQLPETPERLTGPADILLLRNGDRIRPLVLFDVAGEDLQAVGDAELARFLVGTSAVIFVHGLEPTPDRDGNQALEMSLARLQAVADHQRLPAAIVATKADRLRYQALVSRWLRHHDGGVDPRLLHLESRDVYAFLHHRQEHAALAPFSVFDRCTLHFVTASGSDAVDAAYPRGFHPGRVLQPLVAVLAMAGVLDGAEVGM